MATLTRETVTAAGLAEAYTAVSASDEFPNSSTPTFVRIVNAGASPTTATFVTTFTRADGNGTLALADNPVTVTAGTAQTIGPFNSATYGTTVTVTFSNTTSVTIACWTYV